MKQGETAGLAARLATVLGDAKGADTVRYGLRDDGKVGLDCLKVVPAIGKEPHLGISHAHIGGRFVLRLHRSPDLLSWTHVVDLDTNASQGDLAPQPDGSWWLAYEHDEPNSVFIRLRRYATRADLERGRWSWESTLGRTLAPTAEGTPTFERIERDAVRLRFHYYRDGDVDRAASGILRGLGDWTTAKDSAVDVAVEARGVRGNIGGRCRLRLGGRYWWLQEGQLRKNDWGSWRTWLLDDPVRGATPVVLSTHAGSTAFANPFATVLPGAGARLLVTYFVPSEGAGSGEAGTLLMVKSLAGSDLI